VPVPKDGAVSEAAESAQIKKHYALMAKKERGLALKAADLAQRSESMKADKAELEAWKTERAAVKRDPARFLAKEFGPDWYDKLTEYKLSGGKVTPELLAAVVDEKFEGLKKDQEAERKKAADDDAARIAREEKQFLDSWSADVSDFVKQNADKYELINHFEVHDRVSAKIVSEFQATKKMLTPEQAADLIEKDLEERGSKSKKFVKAPAAPTPADKRNDPPQRRTLSNDMGATSQADKPPPKDDAERMRRAIAAMDAVQSSRRT
jgi:hypothetical protein